MIEKWTKVWVVDEGSILETPKVRAGFVSGIVSSSEYVITHDDGTEKIYMATEIFLSCRDANQHQMNILGNRLNYLRPRVNQMETTLISMTA
jgi:hypothetical protein